MTAPRHRRLQPRARFRRVGLFVAPALIVSTAASCCRGDDADDDKKSVAAPAPRSLEATLSSRPADQVEVSRSDNGGRPPLADIEPAEPAAVDTARRFATTDLNVWSGPGERFKLRTVLDTGSKLAVTGADAGKWSQIVFQGKFAWINSAYVAKKKPEIEEADPTLDAKAASGNVSEAPCRRGSGVEAGLTADAIRVYRSVCAEFPQVTSYGGVRSDDGEHGTGQALDIMATGSLGDAIAAYVRANAAKLGVSEVLWAQQIWTVAARRRGLAEVLRPRLGDWQPLRPRPRHRLRQLRRLIRRHQAQPARCVQWQRARAKSAFALGIRRTKDARCPSRSGGGRGLPRPPLPGLRASSNQPTAQRIASSAAPLSACAGKARERSRPSRRASDGRRTPDARRDQEVDAACRGHHSRLRARSNAASVRTDRRWG